MGKGGNYSIPIIEKGSNPALRGSKMLLIVVRPCIGCYNNAPGRYNNHEFHQTLSGIRQSIVKESQQKEIKRTAPVSALCHHICGDHTSLFETLVFSFPISQPSFFSQGDSMARNVGIAVVVLVLRHKLCTGGTDRKWGGWL